MSISNGRAPKLELNLNLSPPNVVVNHIPEPSTQSTVLSPASSCVSTEVNHNDHNTTNPNPNPNPDDNFPASSTNPEDIALVVVGCQNCFIYAMVREDNPTCPQCKTTTLIHFLNEDEDDDDNHGI